MKTAQLFSVVVAISCCHPRYTNPSYIMENIVGLQ